MTKLLRIFIFTLALMAFGNAIAMASPQNRISEYGAETFYQNFKYGLELLKKGCYVSELHHLQSDEDAYAFTISRPGEENVNFFIEVTPDGYVRQLGFEAYRDNSKNIITSSIAVAYFAIGLTKEESKHLISNSKEVILGDTLGHHSELYQGRYNRTICVYKTLDPTSKMFWVLFSKD